MHCRCCDKELTNITIDNRDGKIIPCSECMQVIQKCIEAMENRDRRKAQLLLWHNEVTGKYSLDEFDGDIEDLEEDDQEYIAGFHFADEEEELEC